MNITGQNNLIYTLDRISAASYGLVISRDNTGLDCREADTVKGFSITASQPSGTDIRFAFADGDNWFTLSTSGTAVTLTTGTPPYELVASSGNTVAQLTALTSIPAFAGKLIRTAVAVSSTNSETVKPSVKFSVKASTASTQNTFTEYSPVYELGENSLISDILFSKIISGNSSVSLQGKIIRQDESESDWLDIEALKGAQAKALQLRGVYYVQDIGVSSARITQADVKFFSGKFAAASGHGRIYSLTQDWYKPIKASRINITHSPLNQSTMDVFTAFRASPSHSLNEALGAASGSRQTFQLAHKNGIRYDTFRVYADSQEIYTGYELNAEAGRVTLTAPEGSVITASYEYGWDKETWSRMTLASRFSLPDYDMSEFAVNVPDNNYSAAAFLIIIKTASGHADNESLGTASGHMQTVQLKHRASSVTSIQYNNGSWQNLSRSNYSLMDDLRLIRFAAPAGKSVRISYDWDSEPVQIFRVTAVYNN